jgi:hypothetical protein
MIPIMKGNTVILLSTFLLLKAGGHSQSINGKTASAQNSLSVTAYIESSVSFSTGPDGRGQIQVANAPDPKESFAPQLLSGQGRPDAALSHRKAVPQKMKTTAANKTWEAGQLQNQLAGPAKVQVEYLFPAPPVGFEVRHEIIFVDVEIAGKAERRPVTLVTVVPQ